MHTKSHITQISRHKLFLFRNMKIRGVQYCHQNKQYTSHITHDTLQRTHHMLHNTCHTLYLFRNRKVRGVKHFNPSSKNVQKKNIYITRKEKKKMYWFYYPHTLRDSVSAIGRIFSKVWLPLRSKRKLKEKINID